MITDGQINTDKETMPCKCEHIELFELRMNFDLAFKPCKKMIGKYVHHALFEIASFDFK